MIYASIIRPLLFLLPAEKAHHFSFFILRLAGKIPGMLILLRRLFVVRHPSLQRTVAGLKFPNPVGLAAGFDKDALAFEELGALGFGFIEIGTVTPRPQEGNPKPRLFRLPADRALINRMGFNNSGVKVVAQRLSGRKTNLIVGGNIGKNKDTPNEKATEDYLNCFLELYPFVDYFVVNISSPNTPGLRALQDKEPLRELLQAVCNLNNQQPKPRPVFLKIAPDLEFSQADDIIDLVLEAGLAGMIISNTTIARDGLKTPASSIERIGAGGLSGKPIYDRSTRLLEYVAKKSGRRFALIASGGIETPQQAKAKLRAGADLVQLYTGFIYEGPGLVGNICRSLINN
jgi:dihydroorotate dehydrogenase